MNIIYTSYATPGFRGIADAYSAGTYGSGTYNCDSTTSTCGATTSSSSGGGLVNTGVAIGVVVTLACLVLMAAIIVRVWRRSAAKAVPQEVEADDETEHVDDSSNQ